MKILIYGLPKNGGGACKERYHTAKILSDRYDIYFCEDSATDPEDQPIVDATLKFSNLIVKDERRKWILENKN